MCVCLKFSSVSSGETILKHEVSQFLTEMQLIDDEILTVYCHLAL